MSFLIDSAFLDFIAPFPDSDSEQTLINEDLVTFMKYLTNQFFQEYLPKEKGSCLVPQTVLYIEDHQFVASY